MVNFEMTRGQISSLEKKQVKFDSQLAEQHALSEKYASERDAAEARARQAETKSLSLSAQLEDLQDKLGEVDRLRKQLQVSLIKWGGGGGGGGVCIGGNYIPQP